MQNTILTTKVANLREEIAYLKADNEAQSERANDAETALDRAYARMPTSDALARLVHDYMRARTIPDDPFIIAEHEYREGLLRLIRDALGEE
jgi:thioredoxin-like negative regulator of GroEL